MSGIGATKDHVTGVSVSGTADHDAKIVLLDVPDADPSCVTFSIKEEDHTMGNTLKHIMSF